MLTTICELVQQLFKKFFNKQSKKKQICDLIVDEVTEQLNLEGDDYKFCDLPYIRRFVFGKALEECKKMEAEDWKLLYNFL